MRYLILLLTCLTASASNVFLFDTNSVPVSNAFRAYIVSADTLAYRNRTDAILNPSIPAAVTNLQWSKASNGVVVAMTSAEVTSITNYWATNSAQQTRQGAIDSYESLGGDARFHRALVKLIVDELNAVRTNPAAILPARTYNQARTAITNAIGANQ
jgi:hypothetical protein